MPLICNNQIVVEKDGKDKWNWHKDLGWQRKEEPKKDKKEVSSETKKRGYMKDNLSNK